MTSLLLEKRHGKQPGLQRITDWLMSWALPLLAGLIYFAAYYPGFTNHDSQSMWLNAFQHVQDPANSPLMDWYAPGLSLLRVWALKSGLGVAGYHAMFCALTYGTWAVLVATMLRTPWHRACAHSLLLLPFIGANLAFQVPDIWVATGLAWMIVALRIKTVPSGRLRAWSGPFLYLVGGVFVLGARQNALLALPVFMVVPLLFRCQLALSARWAFAAAPLAALVVITLATAGLPIREQHKAAVYMAFETIGVWKSLTNGRSDDEIAALEHPRVFEFLPNAPEFYLDRWNHENVDEIIWMLPEFINKTPVFTEHASEIRSDFFRTVVRHPLHYIRIKLLFSLNGLGLTPTDTPPVSWPPSNRFVAELDIPLLHQPLAAPLTSRLLNFNDISLRYWLPLSAPLAWWMISLTVFFWRKEQGRTTPFDSAWLMLLAAYYMTILFFAPLYLPRYVFPVWIVLGVGTLHLLLDTTTVKKDAEGSG